MRQEISIIGSGCRGGSARGRGWWEAGRRTKAQNSFDDFAACADYLVDSGITSPNRLAIVARARSAACLAAPQSANNDGGYFAKQFHPANIPCAAPCRARTTRVCSWARRSTRFATGVKYIA